MPDVSTIYYFLDSSLIFFFRLSRIPIVGYFIGCTIIALICVIIGQLTIAFSFNLNQRFIDRDNRKVVHMHNLSMKALLSRNKEAFTNCNKEANEAFGKLFFSTIALSAASLWPIPFAVGWMQTRFRDVDFVLPVSLPWIGDHVGFMFSFIPIYVLVYILFGRIKHKLPFFAAMSRKMMRYDDECGEKMISITDLIKPPQKSDRTP